MSYLQKNIKKYIASDDLYHLTDRDKITMLKIVVENNLKQWKKHKEDIEGKENIVYGDLYLINLLCEQNKLDIAEKIIKYGISHNSFNHHVQRKDETMMKYIEEVKAITFYDMCLGFACKNNFKTMIHLCLHLGATFCSICFNVKHPDV